MYLNTRRKLLTVEHQKLSSDNGKCKLFDSSNSERDFGTSVAFSGHNNSNLALFDNHGCQIVEWELFLLEKAPIRCFKEVYSRVFSGVWTRFCSVSFPEH